MTKTIEREKEATAYSHLIPFHRWEDWHSALSGLRSYPMISDHLYLYPFSSPHFCTKYPYHFHM